MCRTRPCDASYACSPTPLPGLATPLAARGGIEIVFFFFFFSSSRFCLASSSLASRILPVLHAHDMRPRTKSKNARNKLEDVSFAIPPRWCSSRGNGRAPLLFFFLFFFNLREIPGSPRWRTERAPVPPVVGNRPDRRARERA